ncbi:MAG: hypothetical protein ACLRZ9_04740 [Eubacterium sp.]
MHSIYLHDVDFHLPTEEEKDQIRDFQNRHIAKCWFKRFLIVLAVISIFVVFQLLARQTVPHMFGERKTVERLLRWAIYAFFGINILSYLELMFETRVIFDIEKAQIAKLQVKKKMVASQCGVIRVKYKYLVCEKDGAFILDRVWVNGAITFSNIKEGQTIYVERLHDEGHYQYYYVA